MMMCLRRWASLVGMGLMALAVFALMTDVVSGQKRRVPPQPWGGSGRWHFGGVQLDTNHRERRLSASSMSGTIASLTRTGNRPSKALQTVLKEEKDYYVKVTETDPARKLEFPRWTSVKFEANNLIGSMDPEGLDVYEFTYGKEAKDLLDEAKAKGNKNLLADVALKYCHTKAGIEANEILATLYLARTGRCLRRRLPSRNCWR